jgi:hypothetical protein
MWFFILLVSYCQTLIYFYVSNFTDFNKNPFILLPKKDGVSERQHNDVQ